MKPVTAADIENAGIGPEVACDAEHSARLEATSDPVHRPEPLLVERERVICVRIDPAQLGQGGSWIKIDELASRTPNREERLVRGAVFEVLTDAHGHAIGDPTQATAHVFHRY